VVGIDDDLAAAMGGDGECLEQMGQRMPRPVDDVRGQRRQRPRGESNERQPERREGEEGGLPAEPRAQHDAQRHAHDRRDRERQHQHAGRMASPLGRKHVGHDRQGQAAGRGACEQAEREDEIGRLPRHAVEHGAARNPAPPAASV
jgi:hypothetical protein